LFGLMATPPRVLVVGCGSTGGGVAGVVIDDGASRALATGGGGSVDDGGAVTDAPGDDTETPGGLVVRPVVGVDGNGAPAALTGGGAIGGMVLVLVGPDGGIGSADDGASTPGCAGTGATVDGASVGGAGTAGSGVSATDCASAAPAHVATTVAMMMRMFPS
jgi:hypothetical protein